MVSEVGSNERQHAPTAHNISQKWWCSITAADNNISNTTQNYIRSSVMPLKKRYYTDLMYQNLRCLQTIFYTDTIYPKVKSITGNDYAHISINSKGLTLNTPFFSNSEVGRSIRDFSEQVGIQNELHFDRYIEQTVRRRDLQHALQELHILWRTSERLSP